MIKLHRSIYLKNIIVLALVCLLGFGCSKKQVEMQTTLPQTISDLTKDFEVNHADCNCHPFINQYTWRNQNIYVLAYNDALDIGYICD
ncbi:MAG TPA: hypothetical protein PLP23_15920 [Panacibacter sp.]|nr:hypothetical protein [Panacibacter sp.]